MSLLVTSVLVAGGVLLGRWIAKSARPEREPESNEPAGARREREGGGGAPEATPPPAHRADPLEQMPCKLGDVVVRAGGDEAWLAGGVVFRERDPISALFVAPEAGGDRAIYVRARPSAQLYWLRPVPPGTIVLGAEPPTSLEHGGVRYERARRLPVTVERFGSGGPDLGERVILAEYASAGFERLVAVTGSGVTRAWAGTVLDEGMYEVIPSGAATLEK